MTEENTQKTLGWFGQPANKATETTTVTANIKINT
jgi:hypothetical protein